MWHVCIDTFEERLDCHYKETIWAYQARHVLATGQHISFTQHMCVCSPQGYILHLHTYHDIEPAS